jgi:hypothetical protein
VLVQVLVLVLVHLLMVVLMGRMRVVSPTPATVAPPRAGTSRGKRRLEPRPYSTSSAPSPSTAAAAAAHVHAPHGVRQGDESLCACVHLAVVVSRGHARGQGRRAAVLLIGPDAAGRQTRGRLWALSGGRGEGRREESVSSRELMEEVESELLFLTTCFTGAIAKGASGRTRGRIGCRFCAEDPDKL